MEIAEKSVRDIVEDHFISLGVDRSDVLKFLSEHSPKTLTKIVQQIKQDGHIRCVGLPTEEEWKQYKVLPHCFESLKRIKYPTLCGWTKEEVIEAAKPYIEKIIRKYRSYRYEDDDARQNGKKGVLEAIRTDAGISPIGVHMFKHIHTAIRRPSAEAGVIRVPERTPSNTTIRRLITIYLTGKAKELRGVINNRNNLLKPGEISSRTVQKIGQKNPHEDLINDSVPLERFHDLTIDSEIGPTTVYRGLITYLLEVLNFGKHDSLYSRLLRNLSGLNTKYFNTVGDLIEYLSSCPDFHGNPTRMGEEEEGFVSPSAIKDVKIKQPEEELIERETKINAIIVLEEMLKELDKEKLSKTQARVFEELYLKPLNKDKEIVPAPEASERCLECCKEFYVSKLNEGRCPECRGDTIVSELNEETKEESLITGSDLARELRVSRQRLTQYNRSIRGKLIIDIKWSKMEDDPGLLRVIKSLRRERRFSEVEEYILVLWLGLDNRHLHSPMEIVTIINDYNNLQNLPDTLCEMADRGEITLKFVNKKIKHIKTKIIRHTIGL